MNLDRLTDDELVQHAYVSQDALTSTPLELELRTRLTQALDTLGELQPLADVLDEFDNPITHVQLRELLERLPEGGSQALVAQTSALREAELDTPDALKQALGWVARLQELTDDPDAALAALETLFNHATV